MAVGAPRGHELVGEVEGVLLLGGFEEGVEFGGGRVAAGPDVAGVADVGGVDGGGGGEGEDGHGGGTWVRVVLEGGGDQKSGVGGVEGWVGVELGESAGLGGGYLEQRVRAKWPGSIPMLLQPPTPSETTRRLG